MLHFSEKDQYPHFTDGETEAQGSDFPRVTQQSSGRASSLESQASGLSSALLQHLVSCRLLRQWLCLAKQAQTNLSHSFLVLYPHKDAGIILSYHCHYSLLNLG